MTMRSGIVLWYIFSRKGLVQWKQLDTIWGVQGGYPYLNQRSKNGSRGG